MSLVVIKYGGNAMINEELKTEFALDIKELKDHGFTPVIVHGGGPQITAMQQALGVVGEFNHGYRETTQQGAEIVQMVMTGLVANDIVGKLQNAGVKALGLSGIDAGFFTTQKYQPVVAGTAVDIGLVGEIISVDVSVLHTLIAGGITPVISGVGPDASGTVLNINADMTAGAIAHAVAAQGLYILTDIEGLYRQWPDKSTLISEITTDELQKLVPTLEAGMIPKIEGCLYAAQKGVPYVHILDGRIRNILTKTIIQQQHTGTMINAS